MSDRHLTLWKCRRTVLEMLCDRGYNVNNYDVTMSYDDFKSTFPNVHLVTRPLEQIFNSLIIHFPEEPKLSVKTVKALFDTARTRQCTNIVVVMQEGVSPQVAEMIRQEGALTCEVFKEEEVIFNVTKHELVPKHRLMSTAEKILFLDRMKLSEINIPQIDISDPVSKYYGAKKGDLFCIERKSEITGTSLYYRIVK